METLEAETVVDNFLSAAVMGRLETVTIIHGKGTGALRKAVPRHPPPEQGGEELPPGGLRRGRERCHRGDAEVRRIPWR